MTVESILDLRDVSSEASAEDVGWVPRPDAFDPDAYIGTPTWSVILLDAAEWEVARRRFAGVRGSRADYCLLRQLKTR